MRSDEQIERAMRREARDREKRDRRTPPALRPYWMRRDLRDRLANACGWICRYCGDPVDVKAMNGTKLATIDHRVPLSRGGTWKRNNLVIACQACNSAKGGMTEEEYLAKRAAAAAAEVG
jgi:5-methylcytosine-specific restriction endonuclease McrA